MNTNINIDLSSKFRTQEDYEKWIMWVKIVKVQIKRLSNKRTFNYRLAIKH